jgi:hypothetical protein
VGPAAAAEVVVAVEPAATAGAVAVVATVAMAGPGAAGNTAVAGPAAAAEMVVAVVASVAETTAAPQTSPAAAAGDGAAAEPGSYSAPITPLSSGAWGPLPPQRIHHCGGASATCPPRGPYCSESWPPPAPSLCQRVPRLRGWTGRSLDRRAGGCRAKHQGSSSRVGRDAWIAIRIPWSSHRALIPLGSTSSSGAYASPVICDISGT